jgi:hypothetical protein
MQEIRIGELFCAARDKFKPFCGRPRLMDYECGSAVFQGMMVSANKLWIKFVSNGEIDESVFVCTWVRAIVAVSCGFHQRDVFWIALSLGAARTGNARPASAIHATAASAAGSKDKLGIAAWQGGGSGILDDVMRTLH